MAERVFAYIDGPNLHTSTQSLAWKIDYYRFRIHLQETYKVIKPIIFLSYRREHQALYKILQQYGYALVIKPEAEAFAAKNRDCVDSEIIFNAMRDITQYDKAVIVSGNGDLYSLVDYLYKQGKLTRLIVPNYYHYSTVLNKYAPNRIDFMNNLQQKLSYQPAVAA